MLALRAFAVWLPVAAAELLHGVLRMQTLRPRGGDPRARQLAVSTGSLIVRGIAYLTRRVLRAATVRQQRAVGLLWLALMLCAPWLGCHTSGHKSGRRSGSGSVLVVGARSNSGGKGPA